MTCRRLAAILVACAALPVASAHADSVLNPSATFAVGSQPMQTAQTIARQHWGVDPCGGQVTITWTPLAPQINATSTWTNPVSSYNNPDLNGDCRIEFNTGMDFDWAKFCTVVVHEYGHLSGKPHSADPHDVMSAYYIDPLPECVAAGAAPAAPAPAQVPVAKSETAAPPARAAQVATVTGARVSGKVHRKRVTRHGRHKHRRARAHRSRAHRGSKARSARVLLTVRHAD